MKSPLIYLSGSIDNITHDEATLWRKYVRNMYPQYRYNDPTVRIFGGGHIYPAEIVEPDKKEILDSDLMLVYYTKSSAGTLMEIMFAYDNNIPTVLVNATNRAYVDLSPWIRYHVRGFASIEESMHYIDKYFAPLKPSIDPLKDKYLV